MMNITSVGYSSGTQSMGGMKRPSDEEILKKITADFGEDAAKSVTKEDGSIDKSKLREFMKSKGIQPPSGGMGASGSMKMKMPSAAELKSKLTEDFGAEKANGVFNNDGTVNETKLKDLLKSEGIEPPPSDEASGTDSESLNASKLLDLFKKENGEEEAKKITDSNGQLDFQKLWGYVSSKMFGQYNQVQTADYTSLSSGSLLNTQA
jgi:hypothetical protein